MTDLQITPLVNTNTDNSPLQLSPIQVNQDYLNEWNEQRTMDFVCLTKNGEMLRPTLYRVGGLNNPKVGKDRYFMLLKYTEDIYDLAFIKRCYPAKNFKEQELARKHLKSEWCILDKDGNEIIVFPNNLYYPSLIKDSCIYTIDNKFYNLETFECYGKATSSFQSTEFLFLNTQYDDNKERRGVIKINKQDGSWELFK